MSIQKNDKLKKLHSIIPPKAVVVSSWLQAQGYTASNIQKYLSSHWIESMGQGAYKLVGCLVEWKGLVFGLQQQFKIHVGGATAMDLLSAAHYVNMGQTHVFLYAEAHVTLPKWFKKSCATKVSLIRSLFLESDMGLEVYDCGGFTISISCRERAMLEMIYGINKYSSFEECSLVMEHLSTLRPTMVQLLLEKCHSIKVKRVFLFLAHKNQHTWYKELDLNQIELGKGDRQIVGNGVYDPQFRITYPKGLIEDDSVQF